MQSAHDQVEALLQRLRRRARDPEVAQLSAQISMLCRAYMEPVCAVPLPDIAFTPNESSIFCLLQARLGEAVSRGALLDAASFHHGWDNEPLAKVIDVYICRMRRKLEGSGFAIQTVWGRGYRLVRVGAA